MFDYKEFYNEFVSGDFGKVDTMELAFENTKVMKRIKNDVQSLYLTMPLEKQMKEKLNPMVKGLIEYIEAKGMKVHVSLNADCAMFLSSDIGYKTILITPMDLHGNPNELVIKLCHELGHFIDYRENYNFNFQEFANEKDDDARIIEIEFVAWHYAEMLFNILNKLYPEYAIPKYEYDELKYDALLSYVGDPYLTIELIGKENLLAKKHKAKKHAVAI